MKVIPEVYTCALCGEKFERQNSGRKPLYCSDSCRVQASQFRRAARKGLISREVVPGRMSAKRVAEWVKENPERLRAIMRQLPHSPEIKEIMREQEDWVYLVPRSAMPARSHLRDELPADRPAEKFEPWYEPPLPTVVVDDGGNLLSQAEIEAMYTHEPEEKLTRQQRRKQQRDYLKRAEKNAGSKPANKHHTTR